MLASHQSNDERPTEDSPSDPSAKQSRKVQWLDERGSDPVHGLDEGALDVRPCHHSSKFSPPEDVGSSKFPPNLMNVRKLPPVY